MAVGAGSGLVPGVVLGADEGVLPDFLAGGLLAARFCCSAASLALSSAMISAIVSPKDYTVVSTDAIDTSKALADAASPLAFSMSPSSFTLYAVTLSRDDKSIESTPLA